MHTKFDQLGWFQKPGAMMAFVNKRRQDKRFPVWLWEKIFLIFITVSLIVMFLMVFVDGPYLQSLKNDPSPYFAFFDKITKLAKSNWILIVSISLIFLMSFASGDRFSGKLHAVWHKLFFTVWFVFYTVTGSGLLAICFKFWFGRPRPRFNETLDVLQFFPMRTNYEFASFPSGHSTTAGAVMIALLLLLPKYRFLIVGFGIIIASTRFLVGAHYPSDVLAGLFLGGMFTWIYARSMAKHRLLFGFDNNGRLKLRNEGKGHYDQIPSMIKKALAQKGVIGVKQLI